MSIWLKVGRSALLVAAIAPLACAPRTDALQDDPSLSVPPRAEELPGPAADAAESLMGVRVEIALDAWDTRRGSLLDQVIPIRVTIDNGSPAPLRIEPAMFRLVSTTSHRTFQAVPPERLIAAQDEPTPTTADVRMRSLPEGELQRGAKTSGFLFFERPDNDELGVRLQVPLVNAATGEQIGVLEVPLAIKTPQ